MRQKEKENLVPGVKHLNQDILKSWGSGRTTQLGVATMWVTQEGTAEAGKPKDNVLPESLREIVQHGSNLPTYLPNQLPGGVLQHLRKLS